MGDPFWHVIEQKRLHVDPAVRALHAGLGQRRFVGRADITRGTHPIIRLALWASGLPAQGRDVPLVLTIDAHECHSDWVRDFDGKKTVSRLWFDEGRVAVTEKFGPFRMTLDLHAEKGQLILGVSRFSIWGIPVPGFLHPVSETREFENGAGEFVFDVSGHLPGLGLIIRYVGHLSPSTEL